MSLRATISHLLRSTGLMHTADLIRYRSQQIKNLGRNQLFKKQHPEVVLPPDYLIYESFQLDYKKYYSDSQETAREMTELFRQVIGPRGGLRILDWGCGPGRIIRHMKHFLGSDCKLYGTDYNKETIKWCRDNLSEIEFNLNTLEPSLPYENNSFDIIYGISIFTHLSSDMHDGWMKELKRVLAPGGMLYLTCQGNAFKKILTPDEKAHFERGDLVIRGNVTEGHRTYSAFQPPRFMENLFAPLAVVKHIEAPESESKPLQDIWIACKGCR